MLAWIIMRILYILLLILILDFAHAVPSPVTSVETDANGTAVVSAQAKVLLDVMNNAWVNGVELLGKLNEGATPQELGIGTLWVPGSNECDWCVSVHACLILIVHGNA